MIMNEERGLSERAGEGTALLVFGALLLLWVML